VNFVLNVVAFRANSKFQLFHAAVTVSRNHLQTDTIQNKPKRKQAQVLTVL